MKKYLLVTLLLSIVVVWGYSYYNPTETTIESFNFNEESNTIEIVIKEAVTVHVTADMWSDNYWTAPTIIKYIYGVEKGKIKLIKTIHAEVRPAQGQKIIWPTEDK